MEMGVRALCSPGWPSTHYLLEEDLELLGFQACTITRVLCISGDRPCVHAGQHSTHRTHSSFASYHGKHTILHPDTVSGQYWACTDPSYLCRYCTVLIFQPLFRPSLCTQTRRSRTNRTVLNMNDSTDPASEPLWGILQSP